MGEFIRLILALIAMLVGIAFLLFPAYLAVSQRAAIYLLLFFVSWLPAIGPIAIGAKLFK